MAWPARLKRALAPLLWCAWAAPLLAVDTSDWDWGAAEEVDAAPVTAPRRASTRKRSKPAPPPVARPDLAAATQPAYALFPDMPTLSVIPSTKDQEMHPCGNCHRWAQSDPTPRQLKAPHDNFSLKHGLHGRGNFWCFTCHDLSEDGRLQTLEGEPLDYDEAYVLCSQCHVNQARDWAFGGHGKRLDDWRGRRRVYNCTACHYQHAPSLPLRDAGAGPEVRQGLRRPSHWSPRAEPERPALTHTKPWQTHAGGKRQ